MSDAGLQEEIEKGNVPRVKYLLDKNGLVLDTDWRDYYLLKSALGYKQKEVTKLLLQKGARVNKISYRVETNETTPLHLAVILGCPEIIETLLSKGALLNVENNNCETPLALATLIGNHSVVDRILSVTSTEKNSSTLDDLSHLHIACMRNRADIVKKFLQSGENIDTNVHPKSFNWPGYTALHFAAEFQCLETVELLIASGADITAKNAFELTPLHLAFRNQNESIIDLILSVHCYISKNPVNSEGLSHFHMACTRNNAKVVDNFLKWGVDVNLKINEDAFKWASYTPLSFAIQHQRIDVIKLLLMYNPVISSGTLNLVYSTSTVKISDLINTKLKLRNQPSIQKLSSLSELHVACVNNDVPAVEKLLNIESVNDMINFPTWFGYTPLHLAVQEEHIDIVNSLIGSGADITAKDVREKTALHLACEKEKDNIVDMILAAHTNVAVNPIDSMGFSHFHIACTRNNLNIIRDFLKSGVDVDSRISLKSAFWPGNTALHFACISLQMDVVELLLDHGADVRVMNGLELTPLESIVKEYGDVFLYNAEDSFFQICDLLLSAHGGKNNTSFFGLSHFHLACARGDSTAVKHLLNDQLLNQPVYLSNWSGRTPLHLAAYYNRPDVIELLLDSGADPAIKDSKGLSSLVLGLLENYGNTFKPFVPCEKLLYCRDTINSNDAFLHFYLACDMLYMKVIDYFLKRGINVNSLFDPNHNRPHTLLHLVIQSYSSFESKKPLIKLLLKNGADINKADVYMNTPLHFAVQKNSTELVKLLLNHGADVNLPNFDGDTPLHSCTKCYYSPEIMNLLMESGTDMEIKNNFGDTFLTCSRTFSTDDARVVPMALSLMKHVKKLQIINFYVSHKNEQGYHRLLKSYNRSDRCFVEAEFAEECENELNYMKTFELDNYTTLRDIIFKEPDKMALHVENIEFRQILDSEDFKDKFPIYGFILKLQLKKGLIRKSVLESSKAPIRSLSTINMPDACYEHITQYLTDEELDSLVKVFSSNEE